MAHQEQITFFTLTTNSYWIFTREPRWKKDGGNEYIRDSFMPFNRNSTSLGSLIENGKLKFPRKYPRLLPGHGGLEGPDGSDPDAIKLGSPTVVHHKTFFNFKNSRTSRGSARIIVPIIYTSNNTQKGYVPKTFNTKAIPEEKTKHTDNFTPAIRRSFSRCNSTTPSITSP
jgi:hypothetical protein